MRIYSNDRMYACACPGLLMLMALFVLAVSWLIRIAEDTSS
jgi:hypothetical protein